MVAVVEPPSPRYVPPPAAPAASTVTFATPAGTVHVCVVPVKANVQEPLLQCPWPSQVWLPVPLVHGATPGTHAPAQAPATHVWFSQV
jgi:hypothetical protein